MYRSNIAIGVAIIIIIVICLPNLALSISSIVIGAQNLGTTCDANSFIKLGVWLIVYGSVLLIGCVVSIIGIILSRKIIYISIGSQTTFVVIWFIIGWIAMYRDSIQCDALNHPLWAMCLAVQIIQSISFGCTILCGKRAVDSSKEEN